MTSAKPQTEEQRRGGRPPRRTRGRAGRCRTRMRQLDERERAPGRLGRLVQARASVAVPAPAASSDGRRAEAGRASRPSVRRRAAGRLGRVVGDERSAAARRARAERLRLRRPISCAQRGDNGQPEDSLTCHQPMSMPMSPRRGRTCQTPQPPSPRSALRDLHEAVAARLEQHLLEQRARLLLRRRARLERDAGVGDAVGELVAQRLELAEGPAAAGSPCDAAGTASSRSRGKALTASALSSRSRRADLGAQRTARRGLGFGLDPVGGTVCGAASSACAMPEGTPPRRGRTPPRPSRPTRAAPRSATAPPRREIRDARHLHGVEQQPRVLRPGATRPSRSAEQRRRPGRRPTADQRAGRPRPRDAAPAARRPGRRRPPTTADAVSTSAMSSASARQAARLEAAAQQPLDRGRLDRRARRTSGSRPTWRKNTR